MFHNLSPKRTRVAGLYLLPDAMNHLFIVGFIMAILAPTAFSTILPGNKACTVAALKERKQNNIKSARLICQLDKRSNSTYSIRHFEFLQRQPLQPSFLKVLGSLSHDLTSYKYHNITLVFREKVNKP